MRTAATPSTSSAKTYASRVLRTVPGLYRDPRRPADPCRGHQLANLNAGLALPVQGISAPDFTTAPAAPGTCAAWLTAANLAPGSDILVVRRADSAVITAAPTLNEVYVQANPVQADVQIGNPVGFSSPPQCGQ